MTSVGLPGRAVYYGWIIIAVCILSQIFSNGLPVNAFSLFLQSWSDDLHAPISSLQLSMALLPTVTAILSPFIGVLADRFPARSLIGGGLVGMAVFCFCVSLITATWQLWVLYGIVLPVTLNLSNSIVTMALVSRWFVRRAGLALGLIIFGSGAAGVLWPPIIATIMPLAGWRVVWRLAAALLAFVVAPTALMLRDRPTEREGLHYIAVDQSIGSHAHRQSTGAGIGWRDVLKRGNFWLLIAVFVPVLATYSGCAYNLAPIAAHHGLATQAAGVLLSVFSLSHVVSALAIGLLSDRFGSRLPLVGVAVVTAGGAILLGLSTTMSGILVAAALVGLAGGLWTVVTASIAVEFGAANVGRAFGMIMAFLPLQALSSFFIAKVQETTQSYAPALVTLAVLCLVGGGLCLMMREGKGRGGRPEQGAVMGEALAPIS